MFNNNKILYALSDLIYISQTKLCLFISVEFERKFIDLYISDTYLGTSLRCRENDNFMIIQAAMRSIISDIKKNILQIHEQNK